MTWADVAEWMPNFSAWVVENFGPLPDGPVREDEWRIHITQYKAERGEYARP